MTGKELLKLIESGSTVICKTNKQIFEDSDFGDENMLVEVSLKRGVDSTNCYIISMNGQNFVKENHAIAKANWYDSNNEPTLKYFERPSYNKNEIDELFVDDSDGWDCGLDILEMDSLMAEYMDSGFDGSYTAWLEFQLYEEREKNNV